MRTAILLLKDNTTQEVVVAHGFTIRYYMEMSSIPVVGYRYV